MARIPGAGEGGTLFQQLSEGTLQNVFVGFQFATKQGKVGIGIFGRIRLFQSNQGDGWKVAAPGSLFSQPGECFGYHDAALEFNLQGPDLI